MYEIERERETERQTYKQTETERGLRVLGARTPVCGCCYCCIMCDIYSFIPFHSYSLSMTIILVPLSFSLLFVHFCIHSFIDLLIHSFFYSFNIYYSVGKYVCNNIQTADIQQSFSSFFPLYNYYIYKIILVFNESFIKSN